MVLPNSGTHQHEALDDVPVAIVQVVSNVSLFHPRTDEPCSKSVVLDGEVEAEEGDDVVMAS